MRFFNHPKRDKLYKFRPLTEYIVGQCKSVYIPEEFVSIDKEQLLWKGRLFFKQYIPNKRSRFRTKLFSLCESSRLLRSSYVYLGKNGINNETDKQLKKELDISGTVVSKLMSEILYRWYKLFVDNCYSMGKVMQLLVWQWYCSM